MNRQPDGLLAQGRRGNPVHHMGRNVQSSLGVLLVQQVESKASAD